MARLLRWIDNRIMRSDRGALCIGCGLERDPDNNLVVALAEDGDCQAEGLLTCNDEGKIAHRQAMGTVRFTAVNGFPTTSTDFPGTVVLGEWDEVVYDHGMIDKFVARQGTDAIRFLCPGLYYISARAAIARDGSPGGTTPPDHRLTVLRSRPRINNTIIAEQNINLFDADEGTTGERVTMMRGGDQPGWTAATTWPVAAGDVFRHRIDYRYTPVGTPLEKFSDVTITYLGELLS